MQAIIGAQLIASLKPTEKPYEVRDSRLIGFLVRVQPSGSMSYVVEYGRGKRITIGRVGKLKPAVARDKAEQLLADAVLGKDHQAAKRAAKAHDFADYLKHEYGPWVETHRKDGAATLARLKACFTADLGKKKLVDITPWVVEKWRAARLKSGIAPATINRDLSALKAALSKAVEWSLLESHPLAKLKPSKVDHSPKVRFLDEAEEQRLRKALDAREERIRAERERANAWRAARGHDLLPDLRAVAYVDHLKPMVLLAMNTGMRRGELLNLTWENVDQPRALVTVVAATAKSGKTRHIPLNAEALAVLKGWKDASGRESGLVFPGVDDKPMGHIKTSWEGVLESAKIQNFRFHDLRHHFASKLVMAGVDLNTVRELLGHGDIKMTLRYAHLAPEHKAAAVAKLVGGARNDQA